MATVTVVETIDMRPLPGITIANTRMASSAAMVRIIMGLGTSIVMAIAATRGTDMRIDMCAAMSLMAQAIMAHLCRAAALLSGLMALVFQSMPVGSLGPQRVY